MGGCYSRGIKTESHVSIAEYPLHKAVETDSIKSAVKSLDDDYDIESRDHNGRTPLEIAILNYKGNTDMTIFLIQMGAKINTNHPINGKTPLQLAIDEDKFDLANIMLSYYEAKIKMPNESSRDALHCLVGKIALGNTSQEVWDLMKTIIENSPATVNSNQLGLTLLKVLQDNDPNGTIVDKFQQIYLEINRSSSDMQDGSNSSTMAEDTAHKTQYILDNALLKMAGVSASEESLN